METLQVCFYAFGLLHGSKLPKAAVAVQHNNVLPFYKKLELPVGAVLTDNGREFCGTETHPYDLSLELNGIAHRSTPVRSPKTYGFVERFNGTVLDEFFRITIRDASTKASRHCRLTSMPGSRTTTPNGPIWATAIRDGDRLKRPSGLPM